MSKPLIASIAKLAYEKALKPLLFKFDPEKVHNRALKLGVRLGNSAIATKITTKLLGKRYLNLNRVVDGIHYTSPIGLAAGFDKNAELLEVLPSIGFGFMEVGSVTQRSYAGNTGKRLVRAPGEKGIFVNYGLKSEGASVVSERLQVYRRKHPKSSFPIGVSIAPTNDGRCSTIKAMIEEYVWGMEHFKTAADYLTLNLSCPNTACGQPFLEAKNLKRLLDALPQVGIPVYLKFSPDSDDALLIELLSEASNQPIVSGVVLSNLTKDRSKLHNPERYSDIQGGLSGKVLFPTTLKRIREIKATFGDRFTLIACGGITTATEVLELERAGANLVQVVTAIIYGGPSTVALINAELSRLHALGNNF
jgi:dihydroorotate dehydrogenase subfamily 2